MQTRQNVEKMAKCGDFFSGARGNANLMINFFGLIRFFSLVFHVHRCFFVWAIIGGGTDILLSYIYKDSRRYWEMLKRRQKS